MKQCFQKGFSFGFTSGIITTLGLVVGLQSGTNSKLAVVGGILTIAIADALSDAIGVHISEESENVHSPREIWGATFATFISKLVIALTFLPPVLLLPLGSAIVASIVWGIALVGIFSFYMAKREKQRPLRIIFEHVSLAVTVVIITHFAGNLINYYSLSIH